VSPSLLFLNALRPAPVWPTPPWTSRLQRTHLLLAALLAGLLLAGCATPPPVADAPAAAPLEAPPAPRAAAPEPPPAPGARPASGFDEIWPEPALGPEAAVWQWAEAQPLPPPLVRANSLWQPVRWSELPGWGRDALPQAWNAWLRSCERPAPPWAPCARRCAA